MKLRVVLVLMISVLLALGLTRIAGAAGTEGFPPYVWPGPCVAATFTNGTAQAGGTDTLCGQVPGGGINITVNFDGTEVGSAISDQYGYYCVTFTVPAYATAGSHILGLSIAQWQINCQLDYAIAAEVPVAATMPVALPSTGFMLLPAGGLLAGGLGMLRFRKRRR